MDFQAEYRSKLRTPAEAVRAVKNGDWVDYTTGLGFPPLLDAALAARRDELHDVKVRGNLCAGPVQIVECDPEQAHFLYHTWHCSAYERRLCDRGLCYYTPMIFRNLAWYYREFLTVNVAMASVAPMDRHGYFNLSAVTGVSRAILDRADIVILEVNEHLPRLRGGFDEVIHISDVDMVVEGAHAPFTDLPAHPATAEDTAIANLLLPHICDGATVQLGIGGKMLGAHGVVLAVAANGDGAQQVGAVHVHPGVPQDAQGLLVGVAVLVVHTAGDDAHLGQDGVQEDVARAGAGAVVAHLQNICLQVGTAVHKVALCIRFHIAGEQKAGGAVIHPQNDGGIVGVVILRHRAQHGHSGTAQRPDRARSGHLHLQALLLGVLDEILKALGGGFRHGAVHMVCREIGQRSG